VSTQLSPARGEGRPDAAASLVTEEKGVHDGQGDLEAFLVRHPLCIAALVVHRLGQVDAHLVPRRAEREARTLHLEVELGRFGAGQLDADDEVLAARGARVASRINPEEHVLRRDALLVHQLIRGGRAAVVSIEAVVRVDLVLGPDLVAVSGRPGGRLRRLGHKLRHCSRRQLRPFRLARRAARLAIREERPEPSQLRHRFETNGDAPQLHW